MSQIYMKNRMAQKGAPAPRKAEAGPSTAELAAGAAPTQAQMGSRVDLPGEIREKMESSFGADFSNVKLYESSAVADAGAEAVTRGSSIAFAPGKLDLTSTAGQALLGHELSHVVSQARGESAGQGFLNDLHLEAQADRQGMMAARGESVSARPVSPIGASSAVSASGPMQAKKNEEKADIQMERQGMKGSSKDLGYFERRKLAHAFDAEEKRRKKVNAPSSTRTRGAMPDAPVITEESTAKEKSVVREIANNRKKGNVNLAQYMLMSEAGNAKNVKDSQKDFLSWYNTEFTTKNNEVYTNVRDFATGDGGSISGLNMDRAKLTILDLGRECGMDDEQVKNLIRDLMVKRRKDAAKPGEEEKLAQEKETTNAALKQVKGLYYHGLKKVRDKYGVMLTQLHPEDAFNQAGDFWKDAHITQDCMQLLSDAPEIFDPENEEDKEFASLNQYYMATQNMLESFGQTSDDLKRSARAGKTDMSAPFFKHFYSNAKAHEANALANDRGNMPRMREKELRAYRRRAMQKEDASLGYDNFFKDEDESRDTAAFTATDILPSTENEVVTTLEELRRRKQASRTGS